MNKIPFLAIIAIMIGLLAVAGCISTPSSCPATVPAVQQVPIPVLFNTTPVQYVQVNGVKMGYREFGAGEPHLMPALGVMTV